MTETELAPGPTPEAIQDDMRETMGDMMDKVHALQDGIIGRASDAAAAVGDAMEEVRDAVRVSGEAVHDAVGASADAATAALHEGVAAVRGVFDIREHVCRRPWLAVGVAAALGFACGRLLRR